MSMELSVARFHPFSCNTDYVHLLWGRRQFMHRDRAGGLGEQMQMPL